MQLLHGRITYQVDLRCECPHCCSEDVVQEHPITIKDSNTVIIPLYCKHCKERTIVEVTTTD